MGWVETRTGGLTDVLKPVAEARGLPNAHYVDPATHAREAELVLSPREEKGPVKVPVPVDHTVLRAGDHHGSTFYQHRAFARMVREGGEPAVTLRDGAMAVEIGLAAERSMRSGEAVTFDWSLRDAGRGTPELAAVG